MKKSLIVALCGMVAGITWAVAQPEAKASDTTAKPAVCDASKVTCDAATKKACADKKVTCDAATKKACANKTDADKKICPKAATACPNAAKTCPKAAAAKTDETTAK